MVDDILFWIETDSAYNAENRLENISENISRVTGEVVLKGRIGNLRTKVKASGIIIQGSLTKYLYGNNLETMTRKGVQNAVIKLSDELSLSVDDAKVYRFDMACNFFMKNPLVSYLGRLGDVRYFKKSQIADMQTVMYANSRRALIFYDKLAEIQKKGGTIPDCFKGKNTLRYEMRFKSRVEDQFKQEVSAKDLYNEKFYIKAVQAWHSAYFLINRINDKGAGLSMGNVKEIESSLMLMGLQSIGGEEIIFQEIKISEQKGLINKQQATRLRSKIRELTNNPCLTAPSEAIEELDKKINQVVAFCR